MDSNYIYIKKVLNKQIVRYENTWVLSRWFAYKGINASWDQLYAFKIPSHITSMSRLKKDVVRYFNEHKDADCPQVTESCVVRADGTAVSDKINPNSFSKLYIKIPRALPTSYAVK